VAIPPKLAIASRNPGKVREILEICADWPVQWVTFENARWPDVEESGQTYLENGLAKARVVAAALEVPAIADDSGIEVDALGGGPGPRSARFAGAGATDRANLELLVERIRGAHEEERTARYRCVAVCAWPDGRALWTEAACEGRLILEARGAGGFGYDPIFVPEGDRRTMAELSPAEKSAISHRGKALRALEEKLQG
jgi:XTP/dITP diphosphohydrolase